MHWCVLCIYLFFFSTSSAHAQVFTQYETAFNRLGWSHEIGLGIRQEGQHYQFGLKIYEPDFTFEKNLPGVFIKHNWVLFDWGKTNLQTRAALDLFYEKKGDLNFWLSNLMVGFQINRKLAKKLSFNFEMSTGPVLTLTKNKDTNEKTRFQYFNYQAGLGLVYTFSTAD